MSKRAPIKTSRDDSGEGERRGNQDEEERALVSPTLSLSLSLSLSLCSLIPDFKAPTDASPVIRIRASSKPCVIITRSADDVSGRPEARRRGSEIISGNVKINKYTRARKCTVKSRDSQGPP